jgi:UTP--glucose-1-phosphate uridylyltransferase
MACGTLSGRTIDEMGKLGIDVGLSLRILENINAGKYDGIEPASVSGIPAIDGKKIVDVTGDLDRTCALEDAAARIGCLDPSIDVRSIGEVRGDAITFDADGLAALGVRLYPLLAYGVLNGGSASSYLDHTKNRAFNPTLFEICRREFDIVESLSRGKAKGVTPAFVNPDGSPGPSFLELKMRSLLIETLRHRILAGAKNSALEPMFQMTSVFNNDEISLAYERYGRSGVLLDLVSETGFDVTKVLTGVQPMLAAFTHSSCGTPKELFLRAGGKEGAPLAMPGGHGQNFIYLADVYRRLYENGKRFVSLGNVDNVGFTVNPVHLALLALGGNEAGFEFAWRTRVDVKGGVLILDREGRLNCADIGAAISKEEIQRIEKEGKRILFNVASGLFDLEYLVRHLEEIAAGLPMRISDQDKDAGKYAQVEQVTWEVIALLANPLVFGVDKYVRFLASKLLLEGLMASGVGLADRGYPEDPDPECDLRGIAKKLSAGLARQLSTTYGLELINGRWSPRSAAEVAGMLRTDPIHALSCFR